jgi:hypothetical protein
VVSILPLFYQKGNWPVKKGKKRENQPKSGNKILLASIAQLGERKTEDLEAPCSIHGRSNLFYSILLTELVVYQKGTRSNLLT